MPVITGFNRRQMLICSYDSLVAPNSQARIIDAFVNSLDLQALEVKEEADTGRPSYDKKSLLKLYIYGCIHEIRSSRKLAFSCCTNIEVQWMIGGVKPDFRTISDFRKDNADLLKKVFHEFNLRLSGAVEWGFVSVDGTKIQACNSKDKNFTQSKLDDRITWLNTHVTEYLRLLDDLDKKEQLSEDDILTKELLSAKLEDARNRVAVYEGYLKQMEESGASQLSLTDVDAKLMKSKNGFMVSYNSQTAVDSNTHLIRDFQVTDHVTDHGLLNSTVANTKTENPDGILEVVADKGYEDKNDMVHCLENGVVPHVIPDDGKDGYELEVPYEEAEVDTSSTKSEDIKKCLRAGEIPDAYKNVISNMEVVEVSRRVRKEGENAPEEETARKSPEEMTARAAEGYFVRDPERNIVYCPMGNTLRQKCIKPNGYIRYANKTACRQCPNRNKCYHGSLEWKEIDFNKDTLEKPCRDWLKAEGKENEAKRKRSSSGQYERVKKKIVRFTLKPNRYKTDQRKNLSEHPFGTIKRAMNAGYFLLKGMTKVAGEFALFCLGYNIKRATNLLGFTKIMQVVG